MGAAAILGRGVSRNTSSGGTTGGGTDITRTARGCQHIRGGYCMTHGAGATRRWRPETTEVPGPNGTTVREYRQVTYYVCDLGLTRRRQRQTRLSFVRTTAEDNPSSHQEDDARQGELGDETIPGDNRPDTV